MKLLLTSLAAALLTATATAKEPAPLTLYHIGDVPVEMHKEDAYAVMLINDGAERNPSPRYILAISASRTLVDTKSFEVFQAALKTIPRGSTVYQYDSCTVPRSWGLKEETLQQFHKALTAQDLRVSEEPRVTCYCESAKQ